MITKTKLLAAARHEAARRYDGPYPPEVEAALHALDMAERRAWRLAAMSPLERELERLYEMMQGHAP